MFQFVKSLPIKDQAKPRTQLNKLKSLMNSYADAKFFNSYSITYSQNDLNTL